MPIKPENLNRYPPDWKEIVARIQARAGDRCEECGVANHAIGYRDKDGVFHELPGMQAEVAALDGVKTIQIVCTTAHLDHVPENCDESNLKYLCQRCHNRYDMPTRAIHAAETRRKKKARFQPAMF